MNTIASSSAIGSDAPVTELTEHTSTFTSFDGTELFYRHWRPAQPAKRTLVVFHRGHEHSGRFADVVEALGLDDTQVFAWDARGHGESPGERGYAPSFGAMVRDVDTFIHHLTDAHGVATQDMVVLAHSVGAVTVASWVHSYAPRLRGLILATPALRVRLYVPLAILGLRLLQKLRGQRKTFIKSYVKAKMLTHDAAQAASYDADPKIAKAIAVNILLGLHDAGSRLIDDAGAIQTPTLMLAGGSDYVVSLKAQQQFFDRLGSPTKKLRIFPKMFHDVLHEADREPVLEEIRGFLDQSFDDASAPAEPSLLKAEQQGFTHDEYRQLNTPLPALSPKNVFFVTQTAALKTLGRTSRGVRLGFATGFDSGQSLDYVYENRAQGSLGVGRLIDRAYLDALGWRGIRQRRLHLRDLIGRALKAAAADRPEDDGVHLLDIAAGCGRYTLEAIQAVKGVNVTATLRDLDPDNLVLAEQHAQTLHVPGITTTAGDAFDADALARITPTPDVAVVSGLYELFPENAPILASLQGLAEGLSEKGYLIYTGQPWHPQVEMIARTLPSHRGRSWVMRRRTQAELDQLVRAAGFEKVDSLVDEWGIFTVSMARKVSR
ncbi:MAG: bifunctional alpha/beta hydrolase/class I SAM-dependent methyltransferase [Planctomycetota bacterium]